MLVGNNSRTINRLKSLDIINAKKVKVFSNDPSPELAELAGDCLINRLPTREEIKVVTVVLIAGLKREILSDIATVAREEKNF